MAGLENMTTPFFSVCIPTYNMAQFLPEAIDSVLSQTFEDFELLISDNCSKDNTEEVVREYKDKRMIYWKNDSNLEMFANLNKACQKAKGRFIKILTADNVMSPVCLEAIYQAFLCTNHSYKVISSNLTNDYKKLQKTLPDNLPIQIMTKEDLFGFLALPNACGGGLDNYCIDTIFF